MIKLVKVGGSYADEFDVGGWSIERDPENLKMLEIAKRYGHVGDGEVFFGTNQSVSLEDLYIDMEDITNEEASVLEKLLGSYDGVITCGAFCDRVAETEAYLFKNELGDYFYILADEVKNEEEAIAESAELFANYQDGGLYRDKEKLPRGEKLTFVKKVAFYEDGIIDIIYDAGFLCF